MIERFFRIPIVVHRKLYDAATGPVFAAPDRSLRGRVRNQSRLVRTADGREVVSQASVSLPLSTPTIPVDSRVELPDRTAVVVAEAPHDTGLAHMPNYYSIDLT